MENTPPFELSAVRREWIDGLKGQSFFQRIVRRIKSIHKMDTNARARGVLITEKDPIEFAAVFFAAAHLQIPVILANHRWGQREWDQLEALVNPALVFGSSPLSTLGRSDVSNPPPSSILIPTGGTTGGVKLAVHDWSTLRSACEGLVDFMGPGPMNFHCLLPLFHVSGLMQLLRSFHTGGHIAFSDFSELQSGRLSSFQFDDRCISLVPTQLQRLMKSKWGLKALRSTRLVFMGGAPLPERLRQEARHLKIPIVASYGMTETAAMIAVQPLDEFFAQEPAAVYPLKHVQINILNECGELCAVEESGRIQIKSPSLFRGYHGSKLLRSQDDAHTTDDEGFIDVKGRLHILGRTDRLIITGGEKVDPREVEEALCRAREVESALVVAWPHPEWGQQVVALYTQRGALCEKELRSELKAQLANYKVPK
ncbi:MAG: AMP-binding protein, partial [Verrucomicrobiota bacterium]